MMLPATQSDLALATSRPRRQDAIAKTLLAWWGGLESRRGERAELRRAAGVADVFFVPGFHRLLRLLEDAGHHAVSPSDLETWAVVAGTLAHVDEHRGETSVAAQLAESVGNRPRLSGLRFRRLLKRTDPDEILREIVRVVQLLDRRVNVVDLMWSLRGWLLDGDERTKKRWALQYYERAPSED
jgi:CRISPR system Cascade subunit CasB